MTPESVGTKITTKQNVEVGADSELSRLRRLFLACLISWSVKPSWSSVTDSSSYKPANELSSCSIGGGEPASIVGEHPSGVRKKEPPRNRRPALILLYIKRPHAAVIYARHRGVGFCSTFIF